MTQATAQQFDILNLVSIDTIFNSFCAQQGHYMRRNKLAAPVISAEDLREWAGLCYDAFQDQLAAAKGIVATRKLRRALVSALRMTSYNFLEAKDWADKKNAVQDTQAEFVGPMQPVMA